MRKILCALAAVMLVSSPAMAVVQTNEFMDPLDAKFDVNWFQCSGVCCTPEPSDPLGGGGGCTPNPTGCQTILNECSYPIEVKCGSAPAAQAYFSALRKQVKCAGEVDPETMQRAPDAPIR